ncbi:MAG: hypothetical protein LBE02_04775 [Spirochaetaceae bacterium]|nr:hypothetical protein [Spirochaetaceae bacterium]
MMINRRGIKIPGPGAGMPGAGLGLFCCLFLALSFFGACASSSAGPRAFYSGRRDFSLMGPGADLYIKAEVQSVRPILEGLILGGLTGAEIKEFLDMCETLTAAVYMGEERRFYAAAAGRFPSARGGFFFGISRDWEKRKSASGVDYWYSDKSKLGVFLTGKNAYLSNADPFVPPPGVRIPDGIGPLQNGAVLLGWMEDPASALNTIVAAFGVPIAIPAERLIFGVYPGGGENLNYTAVLRFETPTPSQANALVRIFTLARAGIAGADFTGRPDLESLARAFFSGGSPRQEGNALILTSGPMSGQDLALLFNIISLY